MAWQTWRQNREYGGVNWGVFLCNFPHVLIFHFKYKKLLPPSVFFFFFLFLVLSFFCIWYIQLLKWLERWTVKLCTGHCSVGNSGCSPLITPHTHCQPSPIIAPPPPPPPPPPPKQQNTPLTTTKERDWIPIPKVPLWIRWRPLLLTPLLPRPARQTCNGA